MAAATAPAPPPPGVRTRARDSAASWPLADRVGLACCWAAGLALALVAAAIVIYMAWKGISQLSPSLLVQHPTGDVDQSKAGGFLDPIEGTLLLTLIGIALAVPIGVATALWLVEYGRPAPLARAVESSVEIIAGAPSVVLALFGLTVFSNTFFSFMSFRPTGADLAYGRSFLIAGIVMSLIALPLVVGATREALLQVPNHVREASLALGKTKAATIRRVLLPTIRPGIATGTTLGMGRIVGDTAIVILLLGNTLLTEPQEGLPGFGLLRGTGSTLTSYVYGNSPAGEGNAPEKAYAAAFVLMVIVIALNALATRLARGRDGGPAWIR
ncbi:MAG TPA: phosphate ABC transporter permease PstA [Conexibacter sp.]|jgi:phosphate transport system permease protein|nr:phosphate ABC transporter permease PstA [Conexibacter sp.]